MNDDSKVIAFPMQQSRAVNELQSALDDVILSFIGRVTLAEAVGALEIVKKALIEGQE